MQMKVTFLYSCKKRHILYCDGSIKPNSPKQDAKKSQNEKRGRVASEEVVASVENIDIACVSSMNN